MPDLCCSGWGTQQYNINNLKLKSTFYLIKVYKLLALIKVIIKQDGPFKNHVFVIRLYLFINFLKINCEFPQN